MSETHAYPISDLAMAQAGAAGSRVHPGEFRVLAHLGRWFGRPIANYINKQGRQLAEGAVWFRGALATLSDGTEYTQPEEQFIARLEIAERDLVRAHQIALDVVREIESVSSQRNGQLRDAFRNVAASATDTLEALQAYKWAVMERNADADIAAGRVEAFDSVDDLLAHLKQP